MRAQLVRGALGVGGLKLLSLPLTLAASVLLARVLGPAGYGQYAFVMALMSILALPVGPGLGQLITREVARYHHGKEWGLYRGLIRRAHQWSLCGSLAAIILLAGAGVQRADWSIDDRWTLVLVGSFLLPLLGLNSVRSSTLRGLRHVFYAQLPDLIARPSLHLIIAAGLFVTGVLNPAAALGSQIIATGVAFLLGAWLLSRLRPALAVYKSPEYQNGIWGKALAPFMLLEAVNMLNTQIGILALGWLGTSDEVGTLRVAQTGAMLVSLSLAVINLVIAPYVTRASRDRDYARLQMLSRQSARIALVVALPVALPLIFLGGPIIGFIYGSSYAATATWPLAILAAGQLFNVACGSVGLFLTMSGFERDTLNGQLLALAANAIAAAVLIPNLGAVGAALAVALGLIVWNVTLGISFAKRLNLRPTAF